MASIQRSFLWLLVVSLFCGFPTASVLADEEDSNVSDEAKADPFEVPDGTARELFLFINSIKRMKPEARTREAMVAHLRKQIAAVTVAADKVLAQKISDGEAARAVEEQFVGLSVLSRVDPKAQEQLQALAETFSDDPRPAVAHAADFQLLQQAIEKTLKGNGKPTAIIGQIFGFTDKHGLDDQTVVLAAQIGTMLSRSADNDSTEVAAQLLTQLVALMKKSDDPQILASVPEIAGTARRLTLPGNFMKLTGVTDDGSAFDWKSYRGKYVLVDFWATWCGPCRAEIPNVKENLEKYGSKGFTVVGINLDEDRSQYDTYMDKAMLSWQNIMPDEEGNNEMATYYGISGIPTVILVDREGKVVSVNARGPELGQLLEAHLGSEE
jgi:thiol-disulfide isomerase/thioredoxin